MHISAKAVDQCIQTILQQSCVIVSYYECSHTPVLCSVISIRLHCHSTACTRHTRSHTEQFSIPIASIQPLRRSQMRWIGDEKRKSRLRPAANLHNEGQSGVSHNSHPAGAIQTSLSKHPTHHPLQISRTHISGNNPLNSG